MARTETQAAAIPALDPGHVWRLADSFRLSLEASNKSPRTIKAYMEAVGLLATFLERQGMPTSISAITRESLRPQHPALRSGVDHARD